MQYQTQINLALIALLIVWIWLLLYKTETAIRILFGIFQVLWKLLQAIGLALWAIVDWVLRIFTRKR